jgi:hypothetical protein
MTKAAATSRVIGVVWLTTCVAVGTFGLSTFFVHSRETAESLFPLLFATWIAIFFAGRAGLSLLLFGKRTTYSSTLDIAANIDPVVGSLLSMREWRRVTASSTDTEATSIRPFSIVWNPATAHVETSDEFAFASDIPVGSLTRVKPEWTVFRIPSANSILQGIVSPTVNEDIAQLELKHALLESILAQLFAVSEAKRTAAASVRS